jgi:YnbE-like lipoprotein
MRLIMLMRPMLKCAEILFLGSVALTMIACTPRVEVAAPEKPITINLNVKIDHEIRLKVDKDLDEVLSKDSGLF